MVIVESKHLTQASLFNLMGQEISRQTSNNGHIIFDLTDLPQGAYIIKAVGDSFGNSTKKIIKIQ